MDLEHTKSSSDIPPPDQILRNVTDGHQMPMLRMMLIRGEKVVCFSGTNGRQIGSNRGTKDIAESETRKWTSTE